MQTDEEYTDNFNLTKLFSELFDYKRSGYKAIKGFYLMALIEDCRIKEADMKSYGSETELGFVRHK